MNRLVDAVALALAIRNAAQTGTGQETNRSRNNTSLVADDIAEKVAGNNNTVQASGVLDQDHSSAVNKLVLDGQVRELLLKGLGHDLAPQPAGSKNIGLIQRPDLLVTTAPSKETSQTGDALNLLSRVGLNVPSLARAVILLAVTEVDTTSQLSHNNDISAADDLSLEGRSFDKGVGGEEAGSQVTVGSHLLSDLEEALLGPDSTGTPFRATDGAEEDSVGVLCGGEGLVGEGSTVGID